MSAAIHFERAGRLGVATLDRPRALNALSEDMVMRWTNQLSIWRDDPEVEAVVVRAVPGRAFCAGGDIRHVAETVAERGVPAVLPFFEHEYRMNWRIHAYPKPYIALIDGIVMGGGVGLSVHGRHRIMTENTMFAMPETGIGMFPDVGGSYFLSRLSHRLGYHLGLSGRRLHGAECVSAGVGTDFVPSNRLEALFESLVAVNDGNYARVIAKFGEPAGDVDTLKERSAQMFEDAPLEVQMRKVADIEPELQVEIASKSPFAVAVTKELLDRGGHLDFQGCMRMEFHVVANVLAHPDFREGVRALIIDKDKSPKWQDENVRDVSRAAIDGCFSSNSAELAFHWLTDRTTEAMP